MNGVTIILLAIFLYSLIRGIIQGGFGSLRQIYVFIIAGVSMLVAIYLSWQMAHIVSPYVQQWMQKVDLQAPAYDDPQWRQTLDFFWLAIRDFAVLRFGIILLVCYLLISQWLDWCVMKGLRWLPRRTNSATADATAAGDDFPEDDADMTESDADSNQQSPSRRRLRPTSWLNVLAGASVGAVVGGWRVLLMTAICFVAIVLYPQAPFAAYVQQSSVYQLGVQQVIEPFSGEFIKNKVPIWTDAVEREFQLMIAKKYALEDANIPADVAAAAQQITKLARTQEEQARALYQWIGTRIEYDWDKVRVYEQERVWREQTPEDTFRTRKGVCIDYARLYALMARAVELEVRVVTGLGYDGRGGYGPHAWNEVRIDRGVWVPLDATWHSSGKDWFNPPDFYDTHVRQKAL